MIFEGTRSHIAYEIVGEGMDILHIHGLGCDRRLMSGCMEPVFETLPGWRRWYLDLPGMGMSGKDMPLASADALLEALVEFADALLPGPLLLVGESYGGYLVRGLAARLGERVKGVMFLCATFVPEFEERDLPARGALQYDEAFLATLTEQERNRFCYYGVVANAETYGRYRAQVQAGLELSDEAFIPVLKAHYSFTNSVDRCGFPGPALIIAGRQDCCVGYRDAWAALEHFPRATFAVLDMGGHNLQIERPEVFGALVADWLKRI